jgi:two-component system, NtrC family, sensor kinase
VGNVLNSVLVSVRLSTERVRGSRIGNVGRLAGLMQAHEADLGRFLAEDPQGKRLVHYLTNLGEHLASEHTELLTELESVARKADHIKHIVAVQQQFAGANDFREPTDVPALIEDAIRINTLERYGAEIVRELHPMPRVSMNKHKVLQILINLISNARYAVNDESVQGPKRIAVRLARPDSDRLIISVMDTGMGIAPEDLAKIFQHGFTTRREGHGFGLHAAITAAAEMGGSLTAASDGRGHGATFVLELPCEELADEAAQ